MRAKPASQHRSREKRDRILAAMDRLLQKRPFSAISVADLAAEAGTPAATIYQRFSNRDATEFLLRRADQVRVRDPDTAAHFMACVYNFMLLGPLLHDDASSPFLENPERFAFELAVMAYRYLTCVNEVGEGEPR
ncbi:MAG TPA: helix-turn-helix domain-containing protein [Gammaproteobacteria bacterium]